MAAKKDQDEEEGIKPICRNRRAFHQYEISDKLECGIALVGTEVKSLRERAANLEDAFAKVELAVARGKQLHDKRQSLKEADAKRAMQRAVGRKR